MCGSSSIMSAQSYCFTVVVICCVLSIIAVYYSEYSHHGSNVTAVTYTLIAMKRDPRFKMSSPPSGPPVGRNYFETGLAINHRCNTSRSVNEAKRPRSCSKPCVVGVRKRKDNYTRIIAALAIQQPNHRILATATISTRNTTKNILVPASFGPIVVEIGHVQLSQ